MWSALALVWLAFGAYVQAADINNQVPKGARMSRFNSSRRAGAASTQPTDPDRGSGSAATNRFSTDQRLPEASRLMLMSVGMYAVAAVILFAVGLVLEGIAFAVMAIVTTIGAVYLRALHKRFRG
jgi:hypothetical protein